LEVPLQSSCTPYLPDCPPRTTPKMWPFSSSSPSSPTSSPDSSSSSPSPSSPLIPTEKIENPAPSRQQRSECWTSRDAYFDCLTQNGIVYAGAEGGEKKELDSGFCARERMGYEDKCGKTWVRPSRVHRDISIVEVRSISLDWVYLAGYFSRWRFVDGGIWWNQRLSRG